MLTKNVMYSTTPERIVIEELPGGTARVILRDNIHAETMPDMEGSHVVQMADEAVFRCAAEECPTLAEIAEDFGDWMEYASNYTDPRPMTQEEMEAKIFYLMAMQEG